jgi:hypothetical protein
MAYDIPTRFHSLIKASPRNRADKHVWKNNNNSEKETLNSNTSSDNSLGDVIIIRNGAKTTLFGRLNNYISIAGSFE